MTRKRKANESFQAEASKPSQKSEKASGSGSSVKRIRKLAPPRPFPTVPTSVSATGPPSAHREGRNMICITRRTPLGAYLRRCKDILIKEGYKTLHLHALGAAIPHLSRLAVSLPLILPFAPNEIHTETYTGTAELKDEIIPDDEDEDITIQTRGKSTMSVIIYIGDKEEAGDALQGAKGMTKGKGKAPVDRNDGMRTVDDRSEVVFQEGDFEGMNFDEQRENDDSDDDDD